VGVVCSRRWGTSKLLRTLVEFIYIPGDFSNFQNDPWNLEALRHVGVPIGKRWTTWGAADSGITKRSNTVRHKNGWNTVLRVAIILRSVSRHIKRSLH
jgi:hypothetical protein